MSRDQNKDGGWPQINRYAMQYGLWLGAFWIFRYSFLIIAGFGISDRFKFIFYLMNIVTLLLMYIFFYKFKISDEDKPKGIVHCILFMMMMCFYASFLEGAIMYAHFKFIDPAYFANLVSQAQGIYSSQNIPAVILSSKFTYIALEFIKNISMGLFVGIVLNFVIGTKKN